MTFAERIKELRNGFELSQAQFAIKLNVSPSTIAHWELGDRKPSIEMLQMISEKFEVTMDYLIGITSIPNGEVVTKITSMKRKIQVLGRIPAGIPFDAIQDKLDDIEIPSFLDKKKDLFGLVIKGDSMSKIIPDGDIAVFEKTNSLDNGEIGAILVNGNDATVKKFYKLTDSVLLEPVSYNDIHEPMIIKENSQDVSIIGKYVWHCAPQRRKV